MRASRRVQVDSTVSRLIRYVTCSVTPRRGCPRWPARPFADAALGMAIDSMRGDADTSAGPLGIFGLWGWATDTGAGEEVLVRSLSRMPAEDLPFVSFRSQAAGSQDCSRDCGLVAPTHSQGSGLGAHRHTPRARRIGRVRQLLQSISFTGRRRVRGRTLEWIRASGAVRGVWRVRSVLARGDYRAPRRGGGDGGGAGRPSKQHTAVRAGAFLEVPVRNADMPRLACLEAFAPGRVLRTSPKEEKRVSVPSSVPARPAADATQRDAKDERGPDEAPSRLVCLRLDRRLRPARPARRPSIPGGIACHVARRRAQPRHGQTCQTPANWAPQWAWHKSHRSTPAAGAPTRVTAFPKKHRRVNRTRLHASSILTDCCTGAFVFFLSVNAAFAETPARGSQARWDWTGWAGGDAVRNPHIT